MKGKVLMQMLDCVTLAFADIGVSMDLKPNAIREKDGTNKMTSGWLRALKPAWLSATVYVGLPPDILR